jgi:outer membrane lipoprotein-sorting protein
MVSICGFVCAALMLSDAERRLHDEAFARLQQQTQTYQADLKQVVRLRGLQKPVESTGKIYFQAPGSLRLSFTQPAGEYMLMTGHDVYVKKANRPLRHKTADPNTQMLLSLFRGDVKDWETKFRVSCARDGERLIVTLRDERIEIENIVALPSHEIQSVQIRFDTDSSMTYEFTNAVRNQPLDDKLFEASEFDRKL